MRGGNGRIPFFKYVKSIPTLVSHSLRKMRDFIITEKAHGKKEREKMLLT